MKNRNLTGTLLLLLTAFIWGNAFVAQSDGMNYVGPLTFMSTRFILGGAVLIPIILFTRIKPNNFLCSLRAFGKEVRHTLLGGVLCGLLLGIASALQQYGLLFTSVSKAGFITTLYVIFVPIFSVFLKKHLSFNIWIAVILAVAGLYLLCINEYAALSFGDMFIMVNALAEETTVTSG